jgi:hypothetical protein
MMAEPKRDPLARDHPTPSPMHYSLESSVWPDFVGKLLNRSTYRIILIRKDLLIGGVPAPSVNRQLATSHRQLLFKELPRPAHWARPEKRHNNPLLIIIMDTAPGQLSASTQVTLACEDERWQCLHLREAQE